MPVNHLPGALLQSGPLAIIAISTALFLGACNPAPEEQEENEAQYSGSKFSEHIRTTEARTPEEERQGFILPEGFEIQLFASEPDIGKPLNIAFDVRGRLWVTQSYEYPFPAEPGKGTDRLSILEDTDGDGKADTFTHYEDTLNIPIGLLPIEDAAIAYSIPNLYRFTDNNGDDQADQSKVVLGEFGHVDTHGMVNNLTRGYDGWVYTCHGFTNTSTIAGADGDSISMTSGNTFRFLPDGSRVEQTTFGQVNPFGLAYDELGYMYSTDCHTSPIYQLIRGADYPHFGKKEIGIGFGPDTKPMGEESTALSGLALYDATQFPEEYRNNFYIGDVVTCRVHRNSFEFKGSTPVAKAEEDLVKSADPWFRPVDIKLGPDGALYVADFYNSIIGHYEVPLDHPRRDKVRGRIWRITYTGAAQTEDTNLADNTVEELIAALAHDNITVRMMAADQLADQVGEEAVAPAKALLNDASTEAQPYTLALWVLYRLNALDEEILRKAAAHDNPIVRTHVMRILRETDDAEQRYYELVTKALNDNDLHVQRAAVEAIANYPGIQTMELLLGQNDKIPDYDTHYRYTLRLMLRNLMRDEEIMQRVATMGWDAQQAATLADVMVGVENTGAGLFLYNYLASTDADEKLAVNLQHAVRFVPPNRMTAVIRLGREKAGEDLDLSFSIFKAMQEGLLQRGAENQTAMQAWGGQLAENLFMAYLPGNSVPELADTTKINAEDAEKLKLAVELAGNYKLAALAPEMKTVLQTSVDDDPAVKVAAAQALLTIAPEENIRLVEDLLRDEQQPVDVKRRLIAMLGEMPAATTTSVLAEVSNLSPDLQKEVATALSSSPQGRDLLFQKVQEGDVYARALVDPKVKERLLLNISDAQLNTFEALVANVPALTEEKNELIEERMANFTDADSLVQPGVMVFNRNCKSCHRVTNEGGMIGPQLTGIGNWGAEALATKILDPNRNISEAFRTYTIKTKDGQVRTGLFRREEGEAIVFANMNGEEFSVAKSNIAEREPSEYTLMPDHFGEVLPQEDFNALLSYLLNQQ
ncbi:putative heme-binding domain-containing protein [Catalinimonas alkaloidigena]|uniref:PVC-type heme-binding CxxCH protein n=1 Tax=Catalinimonas alkaloidigena TaxID=1075417 RepID=UPI0024066730|nr:PVC-type heme-binding CxxCH protein [Catalinimonas alkaloidigena]MDF9799630.1 putative heme-binding domain-containing protein [Catalinimonas alkaloidigena]